MPPYVYKALKPPLEQIRLIRLLPGEYNDPIMLHMFHAPLSSPAAKPSTSTSMGIEAIQETLPKPWMVFKTVEGSYIYENQETEDTSWTHPDPTIRASMESVMAPVTFESKAEDDYEALSWVWGTSPTHELVYVEDQSRLLSEKSPDNDTYLEIRPNLAQALRHIRPLEKHRTLWIDAICINQKDNAERSAQVRIMGEIYSLAHRVVIWVGPAAKDSRLALDKLRYIGQQVKQCGKFYLLNAPDCIERSIWLGDLRISEAMARALCDLCDRSWFGRLWVLQEVQLSSTRTVLQCGQDQIDWSLFRRAIMILVINRASRPHPEPRPHFEPLLRLAYDMRERDFATLLLAATVMEATEPRDKIYALRNLADKGFRELIRPDYDRPVRMVFEDAVIACIRHDQNLRILIHCNPKDRIATPSWVPDWDHAQPVLPMLCATFASGLARCGIKYITGGVVELEGLQIQSVDLVGSVALPHSDMVAIFRSWEPPDLQTRSYGPGGAMIDAYLATLWLGMTKDYTEWSSAHPTLQECRDFYMYKVHGQIDTAGNGNLYAQHLLQMNIPRFHNRRFFRAGPYLGLGPGIVEPGRTTPASGISISIANEMTLTLFCRRYCLRSVGLWLSNCSAPILLLHLRCRRTMLRPRPGTS